MQLTENSGNLHEGLMGTHRLIVRGWKPYPDRQEEPN